MLLPLGQETVKDAAPPTTSKYQTFYARINGNVLHKIFEEYGGADHFSSGTLSYGYSNPIGYQTSDFRLLWTITPNPQPPNPPMIGLCPPPQNIRHALCPPYQTCPPPPFLLPNSAPCFLDHGRRHELGM